MTTTVFPDTEGALRTCLRAAAALAGWQVEFGMPTGAGKAIVLADAGTYMGIDTPDENARITFSVYASYNPTTRKAGTKAEARAGRDALVGVLFDLGTTGHLDIQTGSHTTRLLGASDINALWIPDLSTTPATPRYVVDATVHAIALS